jgi:hypothetical protein
MADHATVMSAGRVVLAGAAAEIRDTPNLMDVFFGTARHAPAASLEPEPPADARDAPVNEEVDT